MSTHADKSNAACHHVGLGPVAMKVRGTYFSGEIHFSVSVDPGCDGVPTGFVVTGGTEDFAGASGSGTFVPNIVHSGHWIDDDDDYLDPDDIVNDWRSETWEGSITLPKANDQTPPVISGAHGKTVTAPKGSRHARVRFKVTATDAVDGVVYVSCTPESGSRFPIGRTRVKCWAADTSWNVSRTHFTITVKRRGLSRVLNSASTSPNSFYLASRSDPRSRRLLLPI
jgi:hypothetical protein